MRKDANHWEYRECQRAVLIFTFSATLVLCSAWSPESIAETDEVFGPGILAPTVERVGLWSPSNRQGIKAWETTLSGVDDIYLDVIVNPTVELLTPHSFPYIHKNSYKLWASGVDPTGESIFFIADEVSVGIMNGKPMGLGHPTLTKGPEGTRYVAGGEIRWDSAGHYKLNGASARIMAAQDFPHGSSPAMALERVGDEFFRRRGIPVSTSVYYSKWNHEVSSIPYSFDSHGNMRFPENTIIPNGHPPTIRPQGGPGINALDKLAVFSIGPALMTKTIFDHVGLESPVDGVIRRAFLDDAVAVYKSIPKSAQVTLPTVETFSTEAQSAGIAGLINSTGTAIGAAMGNQNAKQEQKTNANRAKGQPPMILICLPGSTAILTPQGEVAVSELQLGDAVVVSESNLAESVAATVLKISKTAVPDYHQMIKISLSDGRSVAASPGHPLIDGRPIESLVSGEVYSDSVVTSVERVKFDGGFAFDILTDSEKQIYVGNGVALGSTFSNDGKTQCGRL